MSTSTDAVAVAVAPAKRPPINKYAFACALLASMNSVLLGYGRFHCSSTDVHFIPPRARPSCVQFVHHASMHCT
jgi:hypothetical protein